jgi:DtxR family transcriptional regulator, Mn-dependent transcriptional regulator
MAGRSESREEYLEAIFKLTQQPEGATVGRVADELGLAAPSASQMVARLAAEGLVERDQASHVLLTKEGRREALRLVRRHRLSERFLTDYLDLPWDQVHDEACKFEHVLSDEVEERLAAHLGNPQTCPHGRAIPTPDGELPEEHARPLAELSAGQKSTISFVSDEQPELLRYLSSLGLLPQTAVAVEDVAPFGGPLLVRVGRARYALGREVAGKIFVQA